MSKWEEVKKYGVKRRKGKRQKAKGKKEEKKEGKILKILDCNLLLLTDSYLDIIVFQVF